MTAKSGRCKRCIYLGIPQPMARRGGFCNWCLGMGDQDNMLRLEKGMRTYPGPVTYE